MHLDSEFQPYLFASSHLSAGSSWTVTTVRLNYTVSGVKTHSMTIYLSPPLFPCITVPTELCSPNDNVIAVTHPLAFKSLWERKHAREFRSLCDLFSDVPRDANLHFPEPQNLDFPPYKCFNTLFSSQVNSNFRPKARATEVWKEIITTADIISTGLRCTEHQYKGKNHIMAAIVRKN